jgi:hypothetical protein
MEAFRLFFAHSFAHEKLNHFGEIDDRGGISDLELADRIFGWIREFGGPRIEVVQTRDPYNGYLSSQVRREICSADGVLCLFTKRTKDHLKNEWLPSTYVISEASAALMQFPSEHETHRRLFGLVEEGVDVEQLGMAFHGNKTAPRFRRDELPQLQSQIKRIIEGILDQSHSVPSRGDREYACIDKVVSIRRSGAVLVETRHRFRFTREINTVRIPHKIWRVSESLPTLDQLLAGTPDSGDGFLRVMPLACGRHDRNRCRCEIKPGNRTCWGYERNFIVEITDVGIVPGEELAYEVVWGYPKAFHSNSGSLPNSVGLRTSGRGPAGSASLTLKFERDWAGEPFRILETPPQLFVTDVTDLPGAESPEEFFHHSDTWKGVAELVPCERRSSALFEVYQWQTTPPGAFHGMAKAIWTPHFNYFRDFGSTSGTTDNDSTIVAFEDLGAGI